MSQAQSVYSFEDPQTNDFAQAVMEGLQAPVKHIPCLYLYDAKGSDLFEEITHVEEYYPTRTEISLLNAHVDEIEKMAGDNAVLIEFGSGSSRKTNILIEAMSNLNAYIPIDISDTALDEAKERLKKRFPNLKVLPVHADFHQSMDLPADDFSPAYRLGFFPGSTIGNLEKDEARHFLKRARGLLGPKSGFVIGVDLQKDLDILLPAYDDAKGVTADFNMNMLRRINRDLEGGFDLNKFRHVAKYNENENRVEMHIESLEQQNVNVLGVDVVFEKGETIHTENSHKYTVEGLKELVTEAGWSLTKTWIDDKNLFSLHYLTPITS